MALKNPAAQNDTSVALAMMTPTTMGTSDAHTASDGTVPKNNALNPTLNTGSSAFTVCVNDTATFPRDTLVNAFPNRCVVASTVTAPAALFVGISIPRFPLVALATNARHAPMTNSHAVTVRGMGNAFSSVF